MAQIMLFSQLLTVDLITARGGQKMTKTKPALRRWIAIVGATQLLGLGLMATVAFADTLRVSCTLLTVCTAGSTTQVTVSGTPTFNLTNQDGALSGNAFLAVAEPNLTVFTGTVTKGGAAVAAEETKSFTSGSIATLFNESGMNDFAFGGFRDASAQVGIPATSFIVSEFNLGAYTSLGGGLPGIIALAAGTLPAGTVIVAWLEDNVTSNQCPTAPCVNSQTPLSGSLTSGTAVPEPGTLSLFAAGLVGVGTLLGTRLFDRRGPKEFV